jgi:transcriptional regulator with XRE-family HTH domain
MSKIAKLRKKQKLTQIQLAMLLGISETTVRNWENGREGVAMIQRVANICKVLNCSIYDLVDEVKP